MNVVNITDFRNYKFKQKVTATWNSMWFWFISKFHVHNWEDAEQVKVLDRHDNPEGIVYIQQCNTCKKRRSQKLNPYGIK